MNLDFLNKFGILQEQKIFKKCIKKIPIDKDLYNLNEVYYYPNEVGLVIPDGFVVIDVDNMEVSELILKILENYKIKCLVNKSIKGRHFIFRTSRIVSQGSNLNTPIGLQVDTRTAGKGYIILPEGSEKNLRSYEYTTDVIDELPFWLEPNAKLNKFFVNHTLRLNEGSRDDTLFKYSKYLKDFTDYNYNEVTTLFGIINSFIFLQPLDQNAVNNKIKEDDFKEDRRKKSKQERNVEIGKDVIERFKIKKYLGEVYMYNGVKYSQIKYDDIAFILLRYYSELLTRAERTEIYNFIVDYVQSEQDQDIVSSRYNIATPNEIINLKTLERFPNDGSIFITNNVYFNYSESYLYKPNEFVDSYFNSLFETAGEINLIYEMIGYCMLSYLPFRKGFFLIGNAKYGKSFFLERLSVIFGEDNISNVDPTMMEKDPRMAGQLKNSLVNTPDDIDSKTMETSSIFKKCVSGDPVNIDVKGKDPITFKPKSTFVITSNYMPSFRNKDDSIYSRLVFVYFKKKIANIIDFDLMWNTEHYEYIVSKSIIAIHNALKNGDFTIPDVSIQALEDFKVTDNDALEYINEMYNGEGIPDGKSCAELYTGFKMWCESSGYRASKKREFEKNIINNTNNMYTIKQTTNKLNGSVDADKSILRYKRV